MRERPVRTGGGKKSHMKEFLKKHPALADAGDALMSLLAGSFALAAIAAAAVKELAERKKN